VIKEVGEAELMLHGEIGKIKQSIIEQLRILEQASALRQLTKEEKMLIDNLSKNLDEAELRVFKEIEDIDVVVGDKATKKRRKAIKN
jgi:DNA replication initiation complex subunit (GINS family)